MQRQLFRSYSRGQRWQLSELVICGGQCVILTLMATSSSSSRILSAPQGCPNKLPVLISSCEPKRFSQIKTNCYVRPFTEQTHVASHRRCIQLSAVMLHTHAIATLQCRISNTSLFETATVYECPRAVIPKCTLRIPRDP